MTLPKCLGSVFRLQQFKCRLHNKSFSARCLSYSDQSHVCHQANRQRRVHVSNSVGDFRLWDFTCIDNLAKQFPRCLQTDAKMAKTDAKMAETDAKMAETDGILADIHEIKNADELLKVFETTGVDQLGPVHVAAALEKLTTTFYAKMDQYPWFQCQNHTIGYIQLVMNKQLELVTTELRRHDVYKLLLKLVDKHFNDLNGLQHSVIYLSLTRLGLAPEDDLSVRLLVRAPDLSHDASFQTLVHFCTMQLSQNRRNPILTHRILEKLRQDLDSYNLERDESNLENMAQLLLSVSYLMSESLCERILDKIKLIIDRNPQVLHDPDILGTMLRLGRRIIVRFSPDKATHQQWIFNHCENTLRNWEDFSLFNDNHIAEICSNLQFGMRYRKEFSAKFRRRSLELIGKKKICVISNLCYAFDSSIPPQERRVIETALIQTIEDADLLNLSNLAESLRLMNCTNVDLLDKFQEKVIENLESVFEYVTRFEKIVRCLLWKNFINPENERVFVQALLQSLNGGKTQFGTRLWSIAMAATYLLQNTRYVIPDILYRKLVDIIPQCSVKDLYPVMIAMNSFQKPMAASTQSQLYHLQTMIYTSIIERLDSILSINLLTSMLRDLVMKSRSPDPNLIEKLMNLYVSFSHPDVTNEDKYMKIIGIHSRLSYHSPLVLDNLTEYALKDIDDMEMRKLLSLYSLLMKVGYVPQNMDALVENTMVKYERVKEAMRIPDRILLFRGLAELQIFPKKQIMDLFSLDFIQLVDKHIAENPSDKKYIEHNMMNLNRSVVLECPELDVPWFHEQYCKQELSVTDQPRSIFMAQVGDILSDIFGGWEYVRRWVFTPYYHTINFEVVLDSNGDPVNLVQIKSLPDNCQRLAIRTLFYSQYCYHRRTLNGFEKAKQRHLQLLGYKIVEIPLHDWNSMGLSDKDSKVDYIKQKISS
ncbi:FAST kinase domain-containing protein 1, mitochondrial-like [Lineus longissimus]|uniref:FAST kinase domain-containing protein 1, mitochondrial-like n=1 Tax=Lineus longissimus TaxID=88925 RepID=UPI002B4E3DE5